MRSTRSVGAPATPSGVPAGPGDPVGHAAGRPLRALLGVLAGALALLLSGCASGPSPPAAGRVVVAPPGSTAVELTYLGVGGWILSWRGQTVLAAPLFSNPSIVRTGLAPIASDTAAVDRWMEPYDVSEARAILVGHGHYDHLMDVPRVAHRHAPRARILGSRTVRNLLGSWSGLAERVTEVEPWAGTAREPGRWIELGETVRVMPLESHHVPHFEGRTLYSGTAEVPRRHAPSSADGWLDGPTFAYLVDFLRADGSVAFRLYYQDAAAQPPWGFPPETLMAERPVDVAILAPSIFDQVDWHPEALVARLRPRWVLLGHWENFFRSPDLPFRPLPVEDLGYFEARLDRVLGGLEGRFWRPEPFTEFRFPVAAGVQHRPPGS